MPGLAAYRQHVEGPTGTYPVTRAFIRLVAAYLSRGFCQVGSAPRHASSPAVVQHLVVLLRCAGSTLLRGLSCSCCHNHAGVALVA
jgi:hypothetical protein